MFGYIEKKFDKRRFLLVKGQNGLSYFSHFYSEVDAPQGHFCVFTNGVPVEFEISDVKKGMRPLAHNLRLAEECKFPSHEISTVYLWKGGFGFARRDCNCDIFISRSEIITEGEIGVGSEIYHSVVRTKKPNGDNSWSATQVEICIPDNPDPSEYQVYPQ